MNRRKCVCENERTFYRVQWKILIWLQLMLTQFWRFFFHVCIKQTNLAMAKENTSILFISILFSVEFCLLNRNGVWENLENYSLFRKTTTTKTAKVVVKLFCLLYLMFWEYYNIISSTFSIALNHCTSWSVH